MKKYVWILSALGLLMLSGCQQQQGSTGFFHHTFVEPFAALIQWTASLFAGDYGLAIIVITLVIRLALSPLMIRQYVNQNKMKEKMAALKPELDAIQKQIKETKDQQKQRELQQEMMGLYSKHGVNPLSMGCLPLVIQMPILMAFYYAIRSSSEIASHHFLWFSLGSPDVFLTLIAGAVYFLQFKVSQSFMPNPQQGSMKWVGLISPIMIMVFSFQTPAVFPLYWTVGGSFLIIQSWVANRLMQRKQAESEALPRS
ncbi:membrane protein insertase YidC 1 [Pullulanibacillus camelliae]|uniref:Membrane protein insertase YidC n=1 Tax=Pullulanibacillus camelliae TaxID=1707096 RepID=A0A8J2YCV1_9BACL|nr:membrane protein insertase YidC [Pullulanibacillus camelliae]GGE38235.1 membrane protein insertase YidC 1 [Pullulanibacillus camelliae]